jgi:phage tail-like protein
VAGRQDPAISARFMVKFGSKLEGAFRECTVVSAEHEVAEYKFADEKGKPGYYAVPGRKKVGRITLKRGLNGDNQCWLWRKEVEDGKIKTARCNGSIFMLDQDGSVLAEFMVMEAWPTKVSGPAPNANSTELAFEECELCFEDLTRVK